MIPAINMSATGAHIRELMDQQGYSVKDIQQKFGFYTPQAVYKWINGDTVTNSGQSCDSGIDSRGKCR